MPVFLERHFRMLAAILLLVMTTAEFAALRRDSQANDESFHLLAGYRYLKTGALALGSEHPPLAQLIAAFPLLFLKLRLPAAHLEAGESQEYAREQEFIYANRYPAETILLWARSAAALWAVALGLVLAWWARRHFGAGPALAALLVLAFDPGFLAHGHYTNNDVPVALCFLAGVLSCNAFLTTGRLSQAVACGALSGIAMSTKYSSLLLFPIYILLYGASRLRRPDAGAPFQHSWSHLVKSGLSLGTTMFLVVFAIFRFETRPLVPSELMKNPEPVSVKILKHTELLGGLAPAIVGHPERLVLLDTLLQRTPVPAASFFRGLFLVTHHGSAGHPTYFLGQYSQRGWWYYFPVVLAIKTPTGLLLLFLLSLAVAARALLRDGFSAAFGKLRRASPDWSALTVPPAFYLLVGVQSHINIGIRHMLPMFPFVFLWVAAVLFSSRMDAPRWVRRSALVCLALVVLESVWAFPNDLGFFNFPSGGARMGPHYVVDSNLDWGQDMIRLKEYLASRKATNVCLSYFGVAPPAYFGIQSAPVPARLEDARNSGCAVVVMSNTQFAFDGGNERRFQWLSGLKPADYVGTSFRVYHLPAAAFERQ